MKTNRLPLLLLPLLLALSLLWAWSFPAQALPASAPAAEAPAAGEIATQGPLTPLDTRAPAGAGGSLILTKTVGLDPSVCATTDHISVTVGTPVYYCYHVTNQTPFTLTDHTLEDTALGTLLDHFPYALAPGASAFITESAIISTTTLNTATWTALNPIPTYNSITGFCNIPDISATGTPLNLSDDGEVSVFMPFHFPFYDRYSNLLRIGNNGAVMLGAPDGNIAFTNTTIPTDTHPYLLAPFWDDLDSETGNVYADLYTFTLTSDASSLLAAPSDPDGIVTYYIVQWDERSHFPGPSASTVTFYLGLIHPGQGLDGYIFYCYEDTTFGDASYDYGASATIGLNKDATEATLYSFDTIRPELVANFGIGFLPSTVSEAAAATDTATVYVPPLTFAKTVGTDPTVCATTDTLTVTIGTEVVYCYSIRNTSAYTLAFHTLEDTHLGSLLDEYAYYLPPQATTFLTQTVLLTTTTVNTATWIATDPMDYMSFNGTCTFPDISGTGTALNLEDNGTAEIELPFDFQYYHLTTNRLTVSNDGVVLFDQPGLVPPSTNEALPTASIPNGIAAYWDDLDSDTGNVYAGWYTYTLQTKANNQLEHPVETPQGGTIYYVIQWEQRSHTAGPVGNTATFYLALIKPGQGLDGYIFACYEDITFGDPALDDGLSATVGLNLNEFVADPFSFNEDISVVENGGIGFIPLYNEVSFSESSTATAIVEPYRLYLPLTTREATSQ